MTDLTAPRKLEPCPFCGGEVDLVECPDSLSEIPIESGRYSVECRNCAISAPAFYITLEKAIAFWNTRSTTAELAEARRVIAKIANEPYQFGQRVQAMKQTARDYLKKYGE